MASPVTTTVGSLLDLALYAGTSSARIDNVLPAAEIVKDLVSKLNVQAAAVPADPQPKGM
jgi:hypothetical protein